MHGAPFIAIQIQDLLLWMPLGLASFITHVNLLFLCLSLSCDPYNRKKQFLIFPFYLRPSYLGGLSTLTVLKSFELCALHLDFSLLHIHYLNLSMA